MDSTVFALRPSYGETQVPLHTEIIRRSNRSFFSTPMFFSFFLFFFFFFLFGDDFTGSLFPFCRSFQLFSGIWKVQRGATYYLVRTITRWSTKWHRFAGIVEWIMYAARNNWEYVAKHTVVVVVVGGNCIRSGGAKFVYVPVESSPDITRRSHVLRNRAWSMKCAELKSSRTVRRMLQELDTRKFKENLFWGHSVAHRVNTIVHCVFFFFWNIS